MKIRTAHVSNSSTSSFVGWGWLFSNVKVKDVDKVKKAMIEKVKKDLEWQMSNIEGYEKVGKMPHWVSYGSFDVWRMDVQEKTKNKIEDIKSSSADDLNIDDSMASYMGLRYDGPIGDYIEGGFIGQPKFDETPRQVCERIKKELEDAGLEPVGEPSYHEEAEYNG